MQINDVINKTGHSKTFFEMNTYLDVVEWKHDTILICRYTAVVVSFNGSITFHRFIYLITFSKYLHCKSR